MRNVSLLQSQRFIFNLAEDLNDNLRNFDHEYISKSTGCEKPCKYRKYGIVDQQPTLLDTDHFTFSLWVCALLISTFAPQLMTSLFVV